MDQGQRSGVRGEVRGGWCFSRTAWSGSLIRWSFALGLTSGVVKTSMESADWFLGALI